MILIIFQNYPRNKMKEYYVPLRLLFFICKLFLNHVAMSISDLTLAVYFDRNFKVFRRRFNILNVVFISFNILIHKS